MGHGSRKARSLRKHNAGLDTPLYQERGWTQTPASSFRVHIDENIVIGCPWKRRTRSLLESYRRKRPHLRPKKQGRTLTSSAKVRVL
ncbi:unnamed protein product [Ectocarpus sp. 8 AP-2014]